MKKTKTTKKEDQWLAEFKSELINFCVLMDDPKARNFFNEIDPKFGVFFHSSIKKDAKDLVETMKGWNKK